MRYIEKYLTLNSKVLEIGAGTGQYSRTIADMGHKVEALELVPRNIQIFKETMNPEQDIQITQGNALDLSMYNDNQFDKTLFIIKIMPYSRSRKYKLILLLWGIYLVPPELSKLIIR